VRRIELFARQLRPDWTCWGNELPFRNVNAEQEHRDASHPLLDGGGTIAGDIQLGHHAKLAVSSDHAE
jgi:hypothetical protein